MNTDRIKQINDKINSFNNEQMKAQGEKESLERTLKNDLELYNSTYQTNLTLDNLEGIKQESDKAQLELNTQLDFATKVFSALETGNESELNYLLSDSKAVMEVTPPAQVTETQNTAIPEAPKVVGNGAIQVPTSAILQNDIKDAFSEDVVDIGGVKASELQTNVGNLNIPEGFEL